MGMTKRDMLKLTATLGYGPAALLAKKQVDRTKRSKKDMVHIYVEFEDGAFDIGEYPIDPYQTIRTCVLSWVDRYEIRILFDGDYYGRVKRVWAYTYDRSYVWEFPLPKLEDLLPDTGRLCQTASGEGLEDDQA